MLLYHSATSRNMITRLFARLGWAVAALVVCCCCCGASAFILPASSLAPSVCAGRTAVLYAGKKAKKKKTKTSSGGGGGFGSTRTANKKQSTPVDAETAALTALYTKQREEEVQRLEENPVPGRLVQISQTPLMFTIDDFIDPEACARVQSSGAGCFDLDFPRLLSDRLFNGQESELDGLLFTHSSSRDAPHAADASTTAPDGPVSAYPDGLHMDTNGQCLFRHVTAILYLNDVAENCGGATVFPLARALPGDPALVASHHLLAERISHTRSPTCAKVGLADDARLLESRVGTDFGRRPDSHTAIRVQPKAGRLLIFFSRHSGGPEDPRAWHAGERLWEGKNNGSATEKRILTMFKEVDYATDLEPSLAETTFEGFLAPQILQQQTWLQAQV
jgi:hypothetical protein